MSTSICLSEIIFKTQTYSFMRENKFTKFLLALLLGISSINVQAQIDVVCRFAEYMIPTLSNSICLITVTTAEGNPKQCTGVLVNNEAQDRRAFILTARHCITNKSLDINLTPSEIASVENSMEVRFRWRRLTCNATTGGASMAIYNQATFRAADFYSDMALFELNAAALPLPPDLNFAGWSRGTETSGTMKFIGHPGGQSQRYANGHKAVPQSTDPYKLTVTFDEGASSAADGASGGPLFSEYGRVIGLLSGSNPGQGEFGEISAMWNSNKPSNKSLKAWLSPNQNLTSIGTLVPMQIGPISNVCTNLNKTATLPNLAPGQSVTWSASPSLTIVSSTGNSVTVKASSSAGGGVGQISATSGPANSTFTTTRDVWWGTPDMGSIKYNGSSASNYTFVQPNTNYTVEYDQSKLVLTNMTGNMNWNPMPGYGGSYGVNFSQYDFNLPPGQSVQFNPVSATNSCGTANRSMGFEAFSGFALYPNPTVKTLYMKFDNSKHLEGLPEDISIYEEATGKIVKQVPIKDAFNKKLIKENVLAIDVKDFPRGTYYLHVRPNKNNKKDIDKIRVVFN
ncbi:trypsin-like peptidase domain-containing protein [Dyadobacter luticola]|nr:trypsin-like peptidase domain-containing protein [Dyadobacter luticola]